MPRIRPARSHAASIEAPVRGNKMTDQAHLGIVGLWVSRHSAIRQVSLEGKPAGDSGCLSVQCWEVNTLSARCLCKEKHAGRRGSPHAFVEGRRRGLAVVKKALRDTRLRYAGAMPPAPASVGVCREIVPSRHREAMLAGITSPPIRECGARSRGPFSGAGSCLRAHGCGCSRARGRRGRSWTVQTRYETPKLVPGKSSGHSDSGSAKTDLALTKLGYRCRISDR
ncbi:hypothetical protein Hoch_0337 [Haliangium ochraceum DSM 14365]|uniref:Uncharacterized protein n=1 Tax=Haliangium ochraceum (strain DSM 14365 / JCM 11303 / SMP-2) TaxID=502025 RepID=D0LIU9_HALO1|nr:hypothetical protein Hoch_0337 [Haliangium ochraceum DSM 14365]